MARFHCTDGILECPGKAAEVGTSWLDGFPRQSLLQVLTVWHSPCGDRRTGYNCCSMQHTPDGSGPRPGPATPRGGRRHTRRRTTGYTEPTWSPRRQVVRGRCRAARSAWRTLRQPAPLSKRTNLRSTMMPTRWWRSWTRTRAAAGGPKCRGEYRVVGGALLQMMWVEEAVGLPPSLVARDTS